MTTLAEYLTIAADNCVHNGDVDIAVLMRQAASTITRQEEKLAASEARVVKLTERLDRQRTEWMSTAIAMLNAPYEVRKAHLDAALFNDTALSQPSKPAAQEPTT